MGKEKRLGEKMRQNQERGQRPTSYHGVQSDRELTATVQGGRHYEQHDSQCPSGKNSLGSCENRLFLLLR